MSKQTNTDEGIIAGIMRFLSEYPDLVDRYAPILAQMEFKSTHDIAQEIAELMDAANWIDPEYQSIRMFVSNAVKAVWRLKPFSKREPNWD